MFHSDQGSKYSPNEKEELFWNQVNLCFQKYYSNNRADLLDYGLIEMQHTT